MKKLLAILLVAAMVLPMCIVAQAGDIPEGTKPFYMLNWDSNFATNFDNIYDMPIFQTQSDKERVELKINCYGENNVTTIAKLIKEDFDARPVGTRFIKFEAVNVVISDMAQEATYMEKPMKMVGDWLELFLGEYYAIGGELDGFVIDTNYTAGSSYGLSQLAAADKLVYHRIVEHPQYITALRPLLEERGFVFFPNATQETPEIFSLDVNSGAEYAQSRVIWDTVARNRLASYLNQAITDTLIKYYPDAKVSDKQSYNAQTWQKGMGDSGELTAGGNLVAMGNNSSNTVYGDRPHSEFYANQAAPVYKNPPAYNKAVYENTPFYALLWDTNLLKNMQASTTDGEISPWIHYYNYNNTSQTSYCNTPYYTEMLYHIGMLNPQPLLGNVIRQEVEQRLNSIETALKVISEILTELTRVAGYTDRKPIAVPANWNNSFILSGMYAGGRNIWRITPDISKCGTLDNFKVEGNDPTFVVGGQAITFPGGKIVKSGIISQVGDCGYWVETSRDVMPVVTNLVNRYEAYPAFAETYESYKADTEYDSANATPKAAWEIKKDKDAVARIQDDAGNKVLALSGTVSIKNVQIPQNITMGDTYAKNQVWEVAVTVPAGMPTEAEIVVLNIPDGGEGGFKIAGGKVYYDNAGTYVELPGVDVSAGGRFILKRSVNLANEGAYISSYTVYNAEGTLLEEAKDIPMIAGLALPVKSIGLGVSNLMGLSVLLDNYKLYTTGVATDFILYDASTGMEIGEPEEMRGRDTAYRLSWMNATDSEKTYTVVAAFYDEGTLAAERVIKEVVMAPGTDAVETGIIMVETPGQNMRVYLKEGRVALKPGNNSDSNNNQTPVTSQPKPQQDMMPIIIAIIAGVVALTAAAVVALLVVKLKKIFAAEKEDTREGEDEVTCETDTLEQYEE